MLKSVGEHALKLSFDFDLFVEDTKGYILEVSYSWNFFIKQYLLGNDVNEIPSLLSFLLALEIVW